MFIGVIFTSYVLKSPLISINGYELGPKFFILSLNDVTFTKLFRKRCIPLTI